MKKLTITMILCVMAMLMLTGCFCSHEWTDATCLAPQTCTKCGETQGEPISHDWQNATCTVPVTCRLCGETAGEPLGHIWQEATCEAPTTCSVCGKTDGEPLGHDWQEATCTEPETCLTCGATEGEPWGHDWEAADCIQPKTCMTCGETEGDVADHEWIEATCTEPKQCLLCDETEGEALGHYWSKETEQCCSYCYRCLDCVPSTMPANGKVFIGADRSRGSEITIDCTGADACYVKLKDRSGNDIFSFFVRANEKVTVEVPSGQYYIYFAHGDTWYGTDYCFGDDTRYTMDDEILDLDTYTYSYTMYAVANGNFSETWISDGEF